MAEPKPFASLSSGLLARKGHARPAMRPQGFGGMVNIAQAAEDLGWNDMGDDASEQDSAPAKTPVVPVVLRQREVLADRVEAEPETEATTAELANDHVAPDATVTAPVIELPTRAQPSVAHTLRAAAGRSGKAAFTLRLPADRHLRLRLACAVRHQSAQQLVTEALDRLLETIPEVEGLARQLPDHAGKSRQGGN